MFREKENGVKEGGVQTEQEGEEGARRSVGIVEIETGQRK